MDEKSFEDIVIELAQRGTIRPTDIPALDLYMDQIMTLFDNYLNDHKRYEDDKLLTKTMINNYSKEGILKPIKGKKYSKEHILQMLLIYSLKNTITIQEVKKVLLPFHEDTKEIEPIYEKYLQLSNEIINNQANQIIEIISQNNLKTDNPNDLTLTILIICSLSNYYQSIAQKMLDAYYSEDNKKRKS